MFINVNSNKLKLFSFKVVSNFLREVVINFEVKVVQSFFFIFGLNTIYFVFNAFKASLLGSNQTDAFTSSRFAFANNSGRLN